MRTLKFLLLAVFCIGATSVVSAQMTTGVPTASKIRTGNRPGDGSFGLYIGATSNMFKDAFNSSISLKALPLLNLKYLSSDKVEWRIGLELYESTETLKGNLGGNYVSQYKTKDRYGESAATIYPGFAYHFSRHNILDVYCGVELPFGNRLLRRFCNSYRR